MKFQIKNRWSDNVLFECELSAEVAGQSYGVQLGFAVKKAVARAADLSDADLHAANLRDADLRDADLSGADLSDADLSGADLSGAKGIRAPIVTNLDAQILAAIEQPGNALDMRAWHACETTHCRAGWAIHLAGEAGYALEDRIGAAAAGGLIYFASTGRIPDFYASNEEALADIRACAAQQVSA